MSKTKLVIIGGVAAGASAAAKARRCSETAEIVILEKGPHISYANCGLPYYLSGVIAKRGKLLISNGRFFKKRFNVEVKTGHEVTGIDRQAHEVRGIDQETGQSFVESYDRLIIAIGADPLIPPVTGVDLPFVFTLKTLEDTDRIHEYLKEKEVRSAVVVGGGLIGMETVENLHHLGIEVTVVEALDRILPFMDPEMAALAQRHASRPGLDFRLSEKVIAIREQDGRGLVETDQGRKIKVDLVLLAVGVRPNIGLARAAGLEIGVTGGIKVDKYMQTSDPAIYAGGDCIESVNLVTGRPTLIPMGAAANKEGRAAGANALGRKIPIRGFTGTVIVKLFDLAVAKTGLSEQEARVAGFTPLVSYVLGDHHAGYYPGARQLHLKIITDQKSGRLLGGQALGQEGVDKRIDILATALYNRMATEELLDLDLAYAPPFSSARDPIIVAGMVNQNLAAGDWQPITPAELNTKIVSGDDFTLVDVRVRKELAETGRIPGALHIPVDELRQRLGELDKEREIVLYCAVGLRSYLGARVLAMHDYKKVLTMTGGIASWTYEVVDFEE